MPSTKTMPAAIKAVASDKGSDLGEGQFKALVSVFNNVDSMGDVVLPGAFSETLDTWDKSGDPIPVIWSHDWTNPYAHIGQVVKAEETDDGLEIVGQLDLESDFARQVYALMKARRVKQFSFAYDVEDGGFGERKADDAGDDEAADDPPPIEVYELRKLALYEVGPCLVGVNQSTELRDVKASDLARMVRHAVRDALVHTHSGTTVPGKGTTSQGQQPRDGYTGTNPSRPNPPRPSPASVQALLNARLTEGT